MILDKYQKSTRTITDIAAGLVLMSYSYIYVALQVSTQILHPGEVNLIKIVSPVSLNMGIGLVFIYLIFVQGNKISGKKTDKKRDIVLIFRLITYPIVLLLFLYGVWLTSSQSLPLDYSRLGLELFLWYLAFLVFMDQLLGIFGRELHERKVMIYYYILVSVMWIVSLSLFKQHPLLVSFVNTVPFLYLLYKRDRHILE